jgi:mannose-1-phosphate guanylyltransferase
MFQHTVDRADQLTPPERRVTVIAKSHSQEALAHLADRSTGKLLIQPANRDTAAGVFLALSYVRACDPHATVIVYPSDHFVYPEDRFLEVVRSAIQVANYQPSHIVLVAATPDHAEPEYGWIQQGANIGRIGEHRLVAVDVFMEKPSVEAARKALLSGALWNTLILASRVDIIWDMGWRRFPEMMSLFERYSTAVGTASEEEVLERIYQTMPTRNLSSHLLQCLSNHIVAIEMGRVLWCDWGRPERIVQTLHRIRRLPAFPIEHALACDPFLSSGLRMTNHPPAMVTG